MTNIWEFNEYVEKRDEELYLEAPNQAWANMSKGTQQDTQNWIDDIPGQPQQPQQIQAPAGQVAGGQPPANQQPANGQQQLTAPAGMVAGGQLSGQTQQPQANKQQQIADYKVLQGALQQMKDPQFKQMLQGWLQKSVKYTPRTQNQGGQQPAAPTGQIAPTTNGTQKPTQPPAGQTAPQQSGTYGIQGDTYGVQDDSPNQDDGTYGIQGEKPQVKSRTSNTQTQSPTMGVAS